MFLFILKLKTVYLETNFLKVLSLGASQLIGHFLVIEVKTFFDGVENTLFESNCFSHVESHHKEEGDAVSDPASSRLLRVFLVCDFNIHVAKKENFCT